MMLHAFGINLGEITPRNECTWSLGQLLVKHLGVAETCIPSCDFIQIDAIGMYSIIEILAAVPPHFYFQYTI